MQALKNAYLRALDSIGDMPSLKNDWRWALAWSVCIYAIVLAFRLSFAGRWDHPELWVNGERIMATHDAYFWLAKAKGLGIMEGFPLAKLAAVISGAFGVSLGAVGFWMPAVMGAMVGVVCYLWGWLLGGRYAGIFAGLAGTLTPGFYFRSRLGYFDTDMFTLLVPMGVAWMLAYWATHHLRRGWFGRQGDSLEGTRPLWLALGFGLVTRVVGVPHQDIINFNVLCTFFAVFVILVGARSGQRVKAIYGLTIFSLAAYPGTAFGWLIFWPISLLNSVDPWVPVYVLEAIAGIALAVGLALAYGAGERRGENILENGYVCGAVLLGCLLCTGMYYPLVGSWEKVVSYLFVEPTASDAAKETMGPIYPSILQSIIEAKKVSLSVILARGAFSAWIGWLALLAGAVVTVLRPAALFLLPLVALHLASVSMGIRFSMFGGAPFMIFLGVGLYWVFKAFSRRFARREILPLAVQVALGGAVLFYSLNDYKSLPMTPVVHRSHAEALVELGKVAPREAMIWTWWDWGYASQYYAGLKTVADGGKHSGSWVYPIGFVMSTPSPEKANRMVAFSAQYPSKRGDIGVFPSRVWDTLPRKELDSALKEQLSRADYPPTPPQYLVVTWKDLRLAKWITYFGNWNLQTGETRQSTLNLFDPGELGINVQQGAVMNREGGGGLVKDITVLDWNSSRTQNYFMNSMSPRLLPKRQHLLVNKVTRQSVVMDRIAYQSLMRKLFTEDPKDPEISKYFKLVVDKLPFARIYEVIQ